MKKRGKLVHWIVGAVVAALAVKGLIEFWTCDFPNLENLWPCYDDDEL